MMPTHKADLTVAVSFLGTGRWAIDLPDGKRILFAEGLTAELFAMRYARESGGGDVLVHDRGRRAPRVISIPGD